jgi:hypothetical protein
VIVTPKHGKYCHENVFDIRTLEVVSNSPVAAEICIFDLVNFLVIIIACMDV